MSTFAGPSPARTPRRLVSRPRVARALNPGPNLVALLEGHGGAGRASRSRWMASMYTPSVVASTSRWPYPPLCAHAPGPRRDHELPDGAAAQRRPDPPVRPRRVPALLSRHVHPAGQEGGYARGLPRVRLGHELVRSLRGGSADAGRAAPARRVLGGSAAYRPGDPGSPEPPLRSRRRGRCVCDAAARALRRRPLPRRPRVPGDRGSGDLPGPLYPAPSVEGHGGLRGREAIPRGAVPPRRSRGADLGRAHQLVDRRNPQEDARRLW